MIMAYGNAHEKMQHQCCGEFMVLLEEEEVSEEEVPEEWKAE